MFKQLRRLTVYYNYSVGLFEFEHFVKLLQELAQLRNVTLVSRFPYSAEFDKARATWPEGVELVTRV